MTDKYAKGLPDGVPNHRLPLPFGYETTGIVTRFTNRLNPYPRSKTGKFAKTDLHADDNVKIVLEEFGRGNESSQKIISKSYKPDDLLQSFRNTDAPRIAVTVNMIATDRKHVSGKALAAGFLMVS